MRLPDLSHAIRTLEAHKKETAQDRAELMQQWIEQLATINQEMRNLEKLEGFSSAIQQNVRDE